MRSSKQLHQLRMSYRQEILCCERILSEMPRLLDHWRKCVGAYYLLSFGKAADKRSFIREPGRRPAAIAKVLLRGTVVDDSGHVTEVQL